MFTGIKGSWGSQINWEVSASSKLPPLELVTAVFCVAITQKEEIILARSKRGWGMLGGHIENGESIEAALERESVEEGGFTPAHPRLFAEMKITPENPVLRPNSEQDYYPFPASYQLYYWATSEQPVGQPSGQEIIESKAFSLEAIRQLEVPDFSIIELGYSAYMSSK